MKISVVIPLYNKEKFIIRAINSVLNQSEQDFEIIVVNDGSTDKSAALVANMVDDTRIRLINQENAGVSAARNRGVSESRSDLIAFLDADDEWLPEFLSTILELKSQFPDGNIFGTLYSFEELSGELSLPKTAHLFEIAYKGVIENFLEILRIGLPFNSSTFVVTKIAFNKIGGFPMGIPYGEDVDTWIRLSLQNKVVYINKPLAIYHRDVENSACERYDQIIDDYYPVKNLDKMVRNGEVPIHFRQSAIEYIAKSQLNLANSYLYHGHPRQARRLIYTCSGTKKYISKWIFLFVCTFLPPAVLQFLIKIKNISRDELCRLACIFSVITSYFIMREN